MGTLKFQSWGLKSPRPLIIAGPCSAESISQLRETAKAISDLNIEVMRAGVWKPRSRPNNFEGAGVEALKWIGEIQSEFDIKFVIEVAKPQHVELALAHDINLMWIGARTTVNPFAVQEIADALKGIDIPILVKNPINPDIELWQGGIERVLSAGITKVAAVHRGFSFFQESKFRNPPAWQIPIELKRRMPEIPLICDPSHICGSRDNILEIAQKAIDLNYDGLMIETHPDPDKAFSDAEQQVTPSRLAEILHTIKIRDEKSVNQVFINQLEQLREEIDDIDREIIEAIGTRMRIIEKIGDYKKDNNVTVFQLERWKEILETRPQWGKAKLLDKNFIEELYKVIHSESIKIQTDILNKNTAKPQ